MINRVPSSSTDITKENIEVIKALFPEILTDGENIDFDMLRTVLGEEIDDNKERYSFTWPGKKDSILGAQKPSKGTLRPDRAASRNFDTTENLYIEGDNLEVLKLLQKSYNGKIKMIYIDPPYNTGNDFVYKDDFKDTIQNYLEQTGQVNDEGKKMSTNMESNGRFHTDWLNMMYPRLKLAKNLLTEDGLICVSIDDNEIQNLTFVMKEIYGEENIKVIAVKMSESSGLKMASVKKQGTIPKLKEYIVLAKRNGIKDLYVEPIKKDIWDSEYNIFLENFSIEDKRKLDKINMKDVVTDEDILDLDTMTKDVSLVSLSEKLRQLNIEEAKKYDWCIENSYRICQCVTSSSVLKLAEQKKKSNSSDLFFVISKNKEQAYFVRTTYNPQSKKPRLQMIFAEDNLSIHPGDFWSDIRTTGLDNEGGVPFKNGKKPLKLINRLINMNPKNDENIIILDFFSGSSTTAHATLKSNSEDNGKRKFIMVQLPEKVNEKEEAYKEGYRFITEIGQERIRRAGDKILSDHPEAAEYLDIGFKVLKLDKSNIREWNVDFDNVEATLDTFDDVFVPGREELDIVYEIMLKNGLELTYPINTFQVDGKNIYDIAFGNLFICLDDEIDQSIAKAIIAKRDEHGIETSTVVFKDSGFSGKDSEKLNCFELLKDAGYHEEHLMTI